MDKESLFRCHYVDCDEEVLAEAISRVRPTHVRVPDPTPAEIEARSAEVRRGWDEGTELRRRERGWYGRDVVAQVVSAPSWFVMTDEFSSLGDR